MGEWFVLDSLSVVVSPRHSVVFEIVLEPLHPSGRYVGKGYTLSTLILLQVVEATVPITPITFALYPTRFAQIASASRNVCLFSLYPPVSVQEQDAFSNTHTTTYHSGRCLDPGRLARMT